MLSVCVVFISIIHCDYIAIVKYSKSLYIVFVCVCDVNTLPSRPVVSESQEAEKMDTDSDSQQGDKVRRGEGSKVMVGV